ncbi:MAG: pilus assembly protein PilE [Proteobacteria bacterium]|nr:MAG: pilus assembly protein PilE [Pseudomonadota bacterium]
MNTNKLNNTGFTLIEIMIVVAIIAVLAAIALPSYMDSVTRSHRQAAKSCLAEYAHFMERYYMTNMAYNKDLSGNTFSLPTLGCATDNALNTRYTFKVDQLTRQTYRVNAIPQNAQAIADQGCGTLSLNHEGSKTVSGSDGTKKCW